MPRSCAQLTRLAECAHIIISSRTQRVRASCPHLGAGAEGGSWGTVVTARASSVLTFIFCAPAEAS
jgi:hypothetical protein